MVGKMNTSADPSTAPPKLTTNPRSVSKTPIAVKKASSSVVPILRWVSVGFCAIREATSSGKCMFVHTRANKFSAGIRWGGYESASRARI